MKQKLRTVFVLGFVIFTVTVISLVGLPFIQFGWTTGGAVYSVTTYCEANAINQLTLHADTKGYNDAGLTQPLVTVNASSSAIKDQKFFVCGRSANFYQIDFAGSLVYVPVSSGTLSPRISY